MILLRDLNRKNNYSYNNKCEVDGKITGQIEQGFCVLIGVAQADTRQIADKMIDKLTKLRIFDDVFFFVFPSGDVGIGHAGSGGEAVALPPGAPVGLHVEPSAVGLIHQETHADPVFDKRVLLRGVAFGVDVIGSPFVGHGAVVIGGHQRRGDLLAD